MRNIFGHLNFVLIYIDDILIYNWGTEEEHEDCVQKVLDICLENNIRINLEKSVIGVKKLKYLGFILCKTGIMANPEKVANLLAFPPPTSRTKLQAQLGSLNFFRKFASDLATILADVTALTSSKVKWHWNQQLQDSLDKAKKLLARKTLLVYPDFSKMFHLYCDASELGIGVVVQYDGDISQPIYFYSQKFNPTQYKYTVVHKEALVVISNLRHLRKLLYRTQITIYTDSLNLSYMQTSNSMKLQRYYLEVMEYSPKILHISGKENKTADLLSRMDFDMNSIEICELNAFTLSTEKLHHEQLNCNETNEIIENIKYNDDYEYKTIEGNMILCKHGTNQMIIPKKLRFKIIQGNHEMFGHPGIQRMMNTIKHYFHWTNMIKDVTEYIKHCHTCQTRKLNRKKYGTLEPTTIDVDIAKFEVVALDLVGPLPKSVADGFKYDHILTIIDIKSRYVELIPLTQTTGDVIAKLFDDNWLCK